MSLGDMVSFERKLRSWMTFEIRRVDSSALFLTLRSAKSDSTPHLAFIHYHSITISHVTICSDSELLRASSGTNGLSVI